MPKTATQIAPRCFGTILAAAGVVALTGWITFVAAASPGSTAVPTGSAAAPAAEAPLQVAPYHPEQPDDPPAKRVLPPGVSPISPPRDVTVGSFHSVQVNVDALGNNIVGDAGNEPSIAVDPTNPSRIVIGWRQFDTVASNFRQAG